MVAKMLLKHILAHKDGIYENLYFLGLEYPEFVSSLFLCADNSDKVVADIIVGRALRDGMNDKKHYKDIYKMAKERVEMFAELIGKSPLALLENQPGLNYVSK